MSDSTKQSHRGITHIISLGGRSGLTLGLGAARNVAAVLVLILLLLLGAAAEHGEDRGRGDRLLGGLSSLRRFI